MTGSSGYRVPRIVGILFGLGFLYGAWILEPRWVAGVAGLIILYAVLTNVEAVTQGLGQVDAGLRELIAPTASSAAGGGHATNR